MNNNNKHRQRFGKKNTNTRFISKEFAIIGEDGKVTATNDEKTAMYMAQEGNKVFQITTYEIKVKQTIKNQ